MNLQTTNTITLDLSIPRIQSIRCVQGDKDSRNITITVTNNRQPYPLDSSKLKAEYKIRKPDGKGIYNKAFINPEGTISVCLSDQATVVPGKAETELKLTDTTTGAILSTMKFYLLIERSVLSNAELESEFESSVIDQMNFHLEDKNNPHAVTKKQIGLGNADNTADKDKNVLSATKLTTKRSINNTEFDGTSNITTNVWGKSRNLSLSGNAIGNTSIDGSSDITIDVTVKNDSHQHTSATLPTATSTIKVVTTLTDSIASASTTTAATPHSVKQAYDLGTAVNSRLSSEISRATNAENTIQTMIDANIANWNAAYSHVSDSAIHVPNNGSSGQILKCDQNGTAVWGEASDPNIVVTGIKGNKETTYRKGNVNITPANIGAASSEVISSGDFNNIVTPGFYELYNTKTNAPTSMLSYALIVMKSSPADISQIAIPVGKEDIYVRSRTSSTWGSWVKQLKTGDYTSNNVVAFTSGDGTNPIVWADVAVMQSGETHSSLFHKISSMFKNVRYLYQMLGTADISKIGNGTVTGAVNQLSKHRRGSLNVPLTNGAVSLHNSDFGLSDDVYITNVLLTPMYDANDAKSTYSIYTVQLIANQKYFNVYARNASDPSVFPTKLTAFYYIEYN